MDKDTRNAIEHATQRARKLFEEDFAAQLEGDFDVHRDGEVAAKAGKHLSPRQAFARERIVAAIEHKRAAGMSPAEAARDYLRDAAFTTLNRFVALKMLEARELVQECITKGEQSAGYREFCGMAPGLPLLSESAGYRLYIESLFDELSTEVKVLFDRRDPSSVLWPKRATFEQLLEILNATELAGVWGEDETVGWVYQFFNGQDERRKMREESQAPRNSRELAVRNQFFTPRYVVQFLTDNTLGRIWYEMRETKTALADTCVYMIRESGEEFARRPKKDPRDLRVLDPACGSGHFLLYAFELLLAIYEEAYADPASPRSEATGRSLAEDYPSAEGYWKAVPGLVLAHNLHGVDIDPRCGQIAQLALWMRAQKAFRDLGISRAARTQIRRTNIVVAEPLVADEQIAKEFVVKLANPELGRVFTSLVATLSVAGEMGLLLRIEQLVAGQTKPGETGDLFAAPEERIRAALDRFVREETSATNTRRRLFADDAAHGVALLQIAEKKFDTVLMNPPFGAPTESTRTMLDSGYAVARSELYAMFVSRGCELLNATGRVGALTNRTGYFTGGLERWREHVIYGGQASCVSFADLGSGVLDDALVEVAAVVIESSSTRNVTVCDVKGATDKAARLLSLIAAPDGPARLSLGRVAHVPGRPFAYWAKPFALDLYRQPMRPMEPSLLEARLGLRTLDDFRFLRLAWECSNASAERNWTPFLKGGPFARYYADVWLRCKWHHNGRELKALAIGKYGGESRTIQAQSYYFRPGLTYTRRTSSRLGLRAAPPGCTVSDKGPLVVAPSDTTPELLFLLGLLNSDVVEYLVGLSLAAGDGAARSFEVGHLQRLPCPPDPGNEEAFNALVRRAWSAARSQSSSDENNLAFTLPRVIAARLGRPVGSFDTTVEVHTEISRRVSGFFGLNDTQHRELVQANSASVGKESSNDEQDEDDETASNSDGGSEALASWLVGVAFGRFDPRLATGERPIPSDPEPFDPLPSRSPGMYPDGEEPGDRPDILVDDEGHADDLAARALAVAERVKVDAPETLRTWLAKEFFARHVRMYSKSRRKAPIYWQLATPSGAYSVWLYIQAFSKDTLFRVQNDYVAPKVAHEERRLEALMHELRDGATAAQRKQLAALGTLTEELRGFLGEVKRVAPLWKPNLDDGVIINFAPLWRLVPQNKAWQKELKSAWDALSEGEYDWAHLAMHLWPERVVPKCAKDRSLAVAHGLEDVFWVEGTDGKWSVRKTPTKSIDELVKERTSAAVKSALKSLLEAPKATAKSTARNAGGRRKAAAAADGGES